MIPKQSAVKVYLDRKEHSGTPHQSLNLNITETVREGSIFISIFSSLGGFCFVFRGGGLTPFRKIACGQWELHGTQTQSFSMCMKQWLWIQAVYTMASTAHV